MSSLTLYHTPRVMADHNFKGTIVPSADLEGLKALGFLYAFEESADCAMLLSFCDDLNQ